MTSVHPTTRFEIKVLSPTYYLIWIMLIHIRVFFLTFLHVLDPQLKKNKKKSMYNHERRVWVRLRVESPECTSPISMLGKFQVGEIDVSRCVLWCNVAAEILVWSRVHIWKIHLVWLCIKSDAFDIFDVQIGFTGQ